MSQLILHKGGRYVSREALDHVWCPEPGELGPKHVPVSHARVADIVREQIDIILGLPIKREMYGLAQKNQQLFGVYVLDTGNPEHGLAVGYRNSVNLTLSMAGVAGQGVFVCDNLALVGDTQKAVRRHIADAENEFKRKLAEVLKQAIDAYFAMACTQAGMAEISLTEVRGAEFIGRGLYQGILTPQQASLAFEAWRRNQHGHGRTLWGVYNAFTYALTRGSPINLMQSASDVHGYFLNYLEELGGSAVALDPARIMPLWWATFNRRATLPGHQG